MNAPTVLIVDDDPRPAMMTPATFLRLAAVVILDDVVPSPLQKHLSDAAIADLLISEADSYSPPRPARTVDERRPRKASRTFKRNARKQRRR